MHLVGWSVQDTIRQNVQTPVHKHSMTYANTKAACAALTEENDCKDCGRRHDSAL
jgi:hypothetical protein